LAGYVPSPESNYGPTEAEETTMNKASTKKTSTKKVVDLSVKDAARVVGGLSLNYTKIEHGN